VLKKKAKLIGFVTLAVVVLGFYLDHKSIEYRTRSFGRLCNERTRIKKAFGLDYGLTQSDVVEIFKDSFPNDNIIDVKENTVSNMFLDPRDSSLYDGVFVTFKNNRSVAVTFMLRIPEHINTNTAESRYVEDYKEEISRTLGLDPTYDVDLSQPQRLYYSWQDGPERIRAITTFDNRLGTYYTIEHSCSLALKL